MVSKKVVLILVLFSSIIIAQYDQNSSSYWKIERRINSGNTEYVFYGDDHVYAGYQDEEDFDNNRFRIVASFNLSSIPANAQIESAKLTLEGVATSDMPADLITFISVWVKEYEGSINELPQQLWNNIDQSTEIFYQAIPRTVSDFSFYKDFSSGSDFCNYVQSKAASTLYLSIIGDENIGYTGKKVHVVDFQGGKINLKVTYTIPPLNITADNNFVGSDGLNHGSIKIDEITRPAPYGPFQKNVGERLSLEAISPQTNNQGYQMFWNTSSCDASKWTRNGVDRSTDRVYSFDVTNEDDGKTYIANFKSTHATTSGNMTTNETWFSNQSLTGNVMIPTGVTLTITPCASVNLNGYSIISTGGTIVNNGSTINGLRARLTANLNLRGLCGTVQAAATNAGSTNEIWLQDGNFNENVSINNKNNLRIQGGSGNFTHFRTLTLTGCDNFFGLYFGAKNVYVNNASYLILSSINVDGIDKSTIGFSLYNSDTYSAGNLTSYNSQAGILCSDGTEAVIDGSALSYNIEGLRSYNGSNVDISNTYFCGTGLDLKTYNFSSIDAGFCYFDGGTPSTSGSNITHYGDQSCSFSKVNPDQQTVNNTNASLTNEGNTERSEFEKINSAYFSLNKKLANAFKEKAAFDKDTFVLITKKL